MATVCRVLSARGPVSPASREKVLKAAEILRYRPNSVARALATGSTRLLGPIVPDITNPFFPHVARGVEDAARQANYTVILGNSDDDAEQELHYVRTFAAYPVDGLILITSSADAAQLRQAIGDRPVVLIDRVIPGFEPWAVRTDNEEGARLVLRHLIDLGHRAILYLGGPGNISSAQERLAGIRAEAAAATLAGRGPIRVTETEGSFSFESGFQRTIMALDADVPFTAVAAANDTLALGAIQALYTRGLRVPEAVSVTGYDDITLARLVSPPLTTVTQPAYQAGVIAAEQLLARLESSDTHECSGPVVLKPRLVVRGSTAPARM